MLQLVLLTGSFGSAFMNRTYEAGHCQYVFAVFFTENALRGGPLSVNASALH